MLRIFAFSNFFIAWAWVVTSIYYPIAWFVPFVSIGIVWLIQLLFFMWFGKGVRFKILTDMVRMIPYYLSQIIALLGVLFTPFVMLFSGWILRTLGDKVKYLDISHGINEWGAKAGINDYDFAVLALDNAVRYYWTESTIKERIAYLGYLWLNREETFQPKASTPWIVRDVFYGMDGTENLTKFQAFMAEWYFAGVINSMGGFFSYYTKVFKKNAIVYMLDNRQGSIGAKGVGDQGLGFAYARRYAKGKYYPQIVYANRYFMITAGFGGANIDTKDDMQFEINIRGL